MFPHTRNGSPRRRRAGEGTRRMFEQISKYDKKKNLSLQFEKPQIPGRTNSESPAARQIIVKPSKDRDKENLEEILKQQKSASS